MEKSLRDDLLAFVDFFERQWREWQTLHGRIGKLTADLNAVTQDRDRLRALVAKLDSQRSMVGKETK